MRSDSSLWDDGAVPWFKSGELNDGYVFNSEEHITTEALFRSPAKLFPPNTVLMAMYGDGKTITTLGILRDEASVNQAICTMVADPARCNFRYLFYALKHHRSELLKLVVAGAQRNLSIGIVRKFTVTHFPVEVQNRISEILSPYDDLIEINRQRVALLEEAASQLYREWFVRLRFPGREHTRIIDGVPEGWERRSLAAVCVDGGIQTGPFGSQLHQSDYSETGVPVVMPKDLVRFRISLDSIARIPEDLANKLGRHRMVYGDVVYGRRGDIGRRAFIGLKQQGFFCGTGSLRIRADSSIVNPRYLFDALGAPATAGTIANRAKGATMLNLNAKILKSVPVLIPPRPLQERYADYVLQMDAMVDVLTEQNEKLRAARDLLLPRLMSGELAV